MRTCTTVGELWAWASKNFSPQEARRALLLATGDAVVSREERLGWFERGRFRRILAARSRGVPWPILEGTTGFLDFEVLVPPGVFIPRPETEELAELAISELRKAPPGSRALDIGTGTGVLAIALARACPEAEVWAVDVSPRALRAARRNAQRLGVKIKVLRSNLFSAVSGKFQVIVANPPYVAREEFPSLPKEVREFEPRRALDGGRGGLTLLLRILQRAPDHLGPGGVLLMELGPAQAPTLEEWAKRTGLWSETRLISDLSGRPRFFLGRRC